MRWAPSGRGRTCHSDGVCSIASYSNWQPIRTSTRPTLAHDCERVTSGRCRLYELDPPGTVQPRTRTHRSEEVGDEAGPRRPRSRASSGGVACASVVSRTSEKAQSNMANRVVGIEVDKHDSLPRPEQETPRFD